MEHALTGVTANGLPGSEHLNADVLVAAGVLALMLVKAVLWFFTPVSRCYYGWDR